MSALDLLSHADPDRVVAFGEAGEKTVADLLADAGRIASALPEATSGSHVLLVLEQDRYSMAAAFIAATVAGHAVALPPNSRRDAILAVHDQDETVAAIHDSDAGMRFRFRELIEAGEGAQPLVAPIKARSGVLATVFTSGSTGPMTAWPKSASELLGEAEMQGRLLEIGPEDRIVGTVAPGHIYGLLFTVLLPLIRGAAFCRDSPLHAEAVAQSVSTYAATVLVTVPVQLRAFAALAPNSFPTLSRVISSTGPLPAGISDAFRKRHGQSVTEIFGSTETGGIAYRERTGESATADDPWTPLENVHVSVGVGGRLRVDSPFVNSPAQRLESGQEPELRALFETQDLVQIQADGRFRHLGRADGVVKIGGRRVQVGEVEECIRQQPGVEDAAVVAIPASGARGHQLVAALAPEGAPVEAIRKALLKRFEPSCLPRRMVRLAALPREDNGKMPRARLLRLFDLRQDGWPTNWELVWGEAKRFCEASREIVRVDVDLPEDYAWFEGHFEGYPVLAGAAQLKELILPSVADAFPDLGRLESMNRVKFLERIVPGAALRMEFSRALGEAGDPVHARVRFQIDMREGATCSVGHLVFAQNPEDAQGAQCVRDATG